MLIFKTTEFLKWFFEQNKQIQYVVDARLKRIEEEDHWGQINYFDGIIELKWASGLRVYSARVGKLKVVVLLGGNKNGQGKDIQKAKKILNEIAEKYFD